MNKTDMIAVLVANGWAVSEDGLEITMSDSAVLIHSDPTVEEVVCTHAAADGVGWAVSPELALEWALHFVSLEGSQRVRLFGNGR